MSDDFVRDLERALVAAARSRAERRAPRFMLPRPAPRALLAGALTLALVGIALLVALGRGQPDTAGDERPAPPRPPSGAVTTLAPMLPGAACRGLVVGSESARDAVPGIGVLDRPERGDDSAIPPPGGFTEDGEPIAWLPVETYDPREIRLAGSGRLQTTVRVFPSRGVSAEGGCDPDDGPGLCLLEGASRWRCFTVADVRSGRALARTEEGMVIGVVPDGIDRVTVSGGGSGLRADVVENVYEARLGVPAGTRVSVAFGPSEECKVVAPALLDRVAALRRPPPGQPLPDAARAVLREWEWQLGAPVVSGARFWGAGEGVGYWVVPMEPLRGGTCVPATRLCVVAVPEHEGADAWCTRRVDDEAADWRLAPLLPDNAVIYGVVPDGVTGVRVTIGDRTAVVEARDNVLGGVLPFPYEDHLAVDVDLVPGPTVGVVAAGGDAESVVRELRAGGYRTLPRITPGIKPQPRTDVNWRPGRASEDEAERVAELIGADVVEPIENPERTPRPIAETDAPIVVVVGSG